MAAIRCEAVDYVPMVLNFWLSPLHPKLKWKNERERLELYQGRGWDTQVTTPTIVTPSKEVRVDVNYETRGDMTILHQVWHTPAGSLEERLKVTDDWPDGKNVTKFLPLQGDFRTSRYVEFPVKGEDDLPKVEYLFPLENPKDTDEMARRHAEARALADEFEMMLQGSHAAGMDHLLWLYPPEEMVLRVVDNESGAKQLLSQINSAYERRLEVLLDLGVDAVFRRGLYESTDFWSPDNYAELAKPPLETEIQRVHEAGALHLYDMMTGVMPLLPQLANLPFDCLIDIDPAYGAGQDLKEIRRALPGKSIWGGISAPEHLGRGTPEDTERAVEKAFDDCGKEGFILGPRAGIRHDWPWGNIEACDRAWRRRRQ
jgi:hypothetical protein